jgi:hypothetical protein
MFNSIKARFYRWRARRTLIARYEYLNEVNKVLEEYLTDKLLRGGSPEFMAKGRSDLATKQAEVRENAAFVDFLRKLK